MQPHHLPNTNSTIYTFSDIHTFMWEVSDAPLCKLMGFHSFNVNPYSGILINIAITMISRRAFIYAFMPCQLMHFLINETKNETFKIRCSSFVTAAVLLHTLGSSQVDSGWDVTSTVNFETWYISIRTCYFIHWHFVL